MTNIQWTHHARAKMRQYGLSEARVKRVINSPRRIEEGIAEDTIALMQPSFVKTTEGRPASYTAPRKEVFKRGSKFGALKGASTVNSPSKDRGLPAGRQGARGGMNETWSQEIWVMITKDKKGKRVISAWRYPGMTKEGQPLPPEIVRELRSGLL